MAHLVHEPFLSFISLVGSLVRSFQTKSKLEENYDKQIVSTEREINRERQSNKDRKRRREREEKRLEARERQSERRALPGLERETERGDKVRERWRD